MGVRISIELINKKALLRAPFVQSSLMMSRCGTLLLKSAAEKFDHGTIECRDIVRLAGADKIAVRNRFFIDPLSPGIAQVGLERWP